MTKDTAKFAQASCVKSVLQNTDKLIQSDWFLLINCKTKGINEPRWCFKSILFAKYPASNMISLLTSHYVPQKKINTIEVSDLHRSMWGDSFRWWRQRMYNIVIFDHFSSCTCISNLTFLHERLIPILFQTSGFSWSRCYKLFVSWGKRAWLSELVVDVLHICDVQV